MKKLIMMAVVACAAVCSQAASVSWALQGTTADNDGQKVYIVSTLADGGFKSEADITNYVLGEGGYTGSFTAARQGKANAIGTVTGLDNEKSGQTQNFYYVVVNSDSTGYWTAASSAEIYTTATTHQDSTVAASTFVKGTATAWSSGPTPPVTPEPTSGLLLVLGMAGLALRRRRV